MNDSSSGRNGSPPRVTHPPDLTVFGRNPDAAHIEAVQKLIEIFGSDDDESLLKDTMFVEHFRREVARKKFSDFVARQGRQAAKSWGEVDLTRYLDNPVQPSPSVLAREDGPCLLYPGETAWIFGEPGAGKTWLAALASAQCVQKAQHVVWLDFESQGAAAVSRLVTLGCSPEDVRKYFHLVEPESAFSEQDRGDLDALLAYVPTLVIFDAANDVLTLQGGRLNDVDTIAKFDTLLLLPFKRAGAAVVVIDHVAKSAESRGLWPINSGHKKACSTVAYSLVARRQFRPGQDGAAQIVVAKDRHGNAPAALSETAGFLVLRGGEFALAPSISEAERGHEVADEQDHRAAVVAAVEHEPGVYAASALASKLAEDYGGSTSTWRRRVGAVLDVSPPLLIKEGPKLRPAQIDVPVNP